MTLATVKQALADWLAPPSVPMLNTVFPYAHTITSTGDALGHQGIGSGALIWVWVPDSHETNLAVPYWTQRKVTYDVVLQIFFRSVKGASEAGQADYDTMIEGLKGRLRQDPRLGTAHSANPIFQAGLGAGQAPTGEVDLRVHSDLPVLNKAQGVDIWAGLDITVVEVVSFTPAAG